MNWFLWQNKRDGILLEMLNKLTRDERQAESVKKWIIAKGKGTLECCTGFKTKAVL